MPWRVPLAAAADNAIALELIAWNAQTSGNAADSQQLRIGLRAIAQRTPRRCSGSQNCSVRSAAHAGSR